MWMGCGLSSLMYPKGWQHRPAPRMLSWRNNFPRALRGLSSGTSSLWA